MKRLGELVHDLHFFTFHFSLFTFHLCSGLVGQATTDGASERRLEAPRADRFRYHAFSLLCTFDFGHSGLNPLRVPGRSILRMASPVTIPYSLT